MKRPPLVCELRRHSSRRSQSISDLANELRIDRRTLQRILAKAAVRGDAADRVAIALGRQPGERPTEWFR
jgi:plasmid maintenance system antidote protein VapI